MPKVFKTRLYIPPHRRGGVVLKTSAIGNPYYEEKPVVVSKPTMRGWRYFRDLKRNFVLRKLEISPATLHETLESNVEFLTPDFCQKIFEEFHGHSVWSDASLCFKILSSLRQFRDYKDSVFFKTLELHMATKLNFA